MCHITTKQKIASSRVFSLGEVKSRTVVVAPVLAEFSMRLLYPSLKFPPPSIFWVRICQNSAETQCLTHKKSCWRLGDTFSPSRDLHVDIFQATVKFSVFTCSLCSIVNPLNWTRLITNVAQITWNVSKEKLEDIDWTDDEEGWGMAGMEGAGGT